MTRYTYTISKGGRVIILVFGFGDRIAVKFTGTRLLL